MTLDDVVFCCSWKVCQRLSRYSPPLDGSYSRVLYRKYPRRGGSVAVSGADSVVRLGKEALSTMIVATEWQVVGLEESTRPPCSEFRQMEWVQLCPLRLPGMFHVIKSGHITIDRSVRLSVGRSAGDIRNSIRHPILYNSQVLIFFCRGGGRCLVLEVLPLKD